MIKNEEIEFLKKHLDENGKLIISPDLTEKQIERFQFINSLNVDLVSVLQRKTELIDNEDEADTLSSDVNADEDDDMKDLETINVYNDLDAFINENNQQAMQLAELDKDTETSSEELTQKKNAVITNYVVNLYNLAKARLQADVDSAYTHTDKYLSYLALMQTFVDAMTSESEEFDKKTDKMMEDVIKHRNEIMNKVVEEKVKEETENNER